MSIEPKGPKVPKKIKKLTTILAADVYGYSRLMANNEETTLAMMLNARSITDELIANHNGKIMNTAGDSIIASFSAPTNAVSCAIEIQ